MNNIYLIPNSVPCPKCGWYERISDLEIGESNVHRCPACRVYSLIKDWLGKRVGMIKDIK